VVKEMLFSSNFNTKSINDLNKSNIKITFCQRSHYKGSKAEIKTEGNGNAFPVIKVL
jgi:hypothetical protein